MRGLARTFEPLSAATHEEALASFAQTCNQDVAVAALLKSAHVRPPPPGMADSNSLACITAYREIRLGWGKVIKDRLREPLPDDADAQTIVEAAISGILIDKDDTLKLGNLANVGAPTRCFGGTKGGWVG